MRVLIIGPGRVGCGFLAPLFIDAGWQPVLTARTEDAAARIADAGGFRVRVTGGPARRIVGLRAVAIGSEAFVREVERADLIVTSVRVNRIEALAPALAAALGRRSPANPVDVWVVANEDLAPALDSAVGRSASVAGLELPPVGFAGAVAGPAVAHGNWRRPREAEFVGDDARWLMVDLDRLTRGLPDIPGINGTRNYAARLREKLYVFNAGHALCAYLGALRGHRTVDAAVRDPQLRPLIAGCLLEARRAVVQENPLLGSDVTGPVAEALRRFGNRELADPLRRVARDPIRKLSAGDRLLGPAQLIRTALGTTPPHFALGIGGALLYRADDDVQARRLRWLLRTRGVACVLRDICGLDPTDELARAVIRQYRGFILTGREVLFPPVLESGPDSDAVQELG